MAKVVIWSFTSSDTLRDYLKSLNFNFLSVQLKKDREKFVLKDCSVIIFHDEDVSKFPNIKWKIHSSGNYKGFRLVPNENIVYIKPELLKQNISYFLKAIENKEYIEEEDIRLLNNTNPDIEELLEQISNKSPLKKDWTDDKMYDVKKRLNDIL